MADGDESVTDVELGVEGSECSIVELSAVVGDDGVRQFEATNNGFPYEGFDFVFSDLGQCLRFGPLEKVVYGD